MFTRDLVGLLMLFVGIVYIIKFRLDLSTTFQRTNNMAYTIGVDYGTNSVRALIVDCANGHEVGSCVLIIRAAGGVLLHHGDSYLARQNPSDYIHGLEQSIVGLSGGTAYANFSRTKLSVSVLIRRIKPLPVDERNVHSL